MQGELYELLLRWIEPSPEKASDRQISPEVRASVVSWAIGAALDWSRDREAPSSNEIAEQALSVIVEGLQFYRSPFLCTLVRILEG